MYGLDNASGINVMPKIAPVGSATPLWFTEGGAGLAASYPGQDWFNMIQAELLNVLTAGGIKPEKGKLTQLSEAIKKIVNSADFQPTGDYITKSELNFALLKKIDKDNITNQTGNSTELVASQNLLTSELRKKQPTGDYTTNPELSAGLIKKLDKTGGKITGSLQVDANNAAVSISSITEDATIFYEIKNKDNSRAAFLGFGSPADPNLLTLRNERGNTTIGIKDGLVINGKKALTTDDLKKNTASLASSGFWKCGETGYIQQWMLVDTKAGLGVQTFPLPTAFPNAPLFVEVSMKAVSGSYGGVTWTAIDRSSVSITNISSDTQASKLYIFIGGY